MQVENQATAVERRFELLVQSVTDYAIYMLDPTGIVTSWNAGAERFKGYKPDEIIGQHFSRFYGEGDRAAGIPERALQTAASEGNFEAEGWRLRKDGSRFWANVVIDPVRDSGGQLIGFAKVTRDLTERRKADEELRRSEERFRLLVQSVTDYAIYMLDPDGLVTSWNAGAERFKGYRAEEIIGQHFSRFYLDEDRAAGVPARALSTALNAGRFEAEGWRLRKDGTKFWASVVIDPVRGDNGDLVGFAKITRDLTERKRAQQALEQAQQAFYQSQKMEAIGQLTGGVAHDFNNLLAAIVGSADLARRRMSQGQDITRFLDNIMEAAQRGATLTQRMLAFARRQDLRLEAVDLTALVRGMADLLERTIGSGVTVDTQFPLTLQTVRADPAQLELGLLNLAVNARDAMPDGGRILISATRAQSRVQHGLAPGDYVCLTVADEGAGMDAATLEKSVEPFFTTKGIGKGTGLGLSMVVGMAEQFGGKATLKSTPGQGTAVTLWLPVALAEGAAAEAPEAATPAGRIKAMTVLAVDDDDIVLLNTAAMLSDLGHTVLQAASGAQALQILGRTAVDLLVTDYAMPQMTGAELADAVRAGWPDLPILMISGYADLPAGVRLHYRRLAKPFRQDELSAAIGEIVPPPASGEVVAFRSRT
ncbi:PAS domain-containing sensor histidine kinase [Novosphingobium sp. P6W]|uniref:hybrid sensor histidine kinase/response regulator n=1 Tax=Novosphingobium sp. P6W TaxID=1609758 RepID=UPI0005C2D144|nr:PAS domain-containing sensor histidine kinase [Novosphingobium sp. P6W]AXB78419.1 PAS domain-containing sensor histidine kinase [Novosphingobium sp. P6W]KIS32357.1 histidine kinase [Novosphingobium sp. P6W]